MAEVVRVMTPASIVQSFDEALKLQRAGRLKEAEQLYRQVIALKPDYAEAHCNLGNVLRDMGWLDDAIAIYHKGIGINPNLPEIYNNLGIALKRSGKLDEAIAIYRKAISLRPDYAKAYNNLGDALREAEHLDDAIAALERSITLDPKSSAAFNNLGIALKARGKIDAAIAAYGHAILLRPDYAEAYSNLGNSLRETGRLTDAVAACRKAIAIKPDFAHAHHNLGATYRDMWLYDEAIEAFERAIALLPTYAQAHNSLGNVLKDTGRLEEAIAAFDKAIALERKNAEVHSSLIFAQHYHAGCDAPAIARELSNWNARHAQTLKKFADSHKNNRNPDRTLRIGYVSPNFQYHVIGRNLLPLFEHHDSNHFEVICYAQVARPDPMSAKFREHAHTWRDIVGMPVGQVAELIRRDRVDILVNLALHMSSDLLLIFARKPAPVQMAFGGYPGGTGLETMDWRLTDPYLDPPEEGNEAAYEKPLRLAHSFWCYDPAAMEAPTDPANPLPALQNGYVTFGCMNNFCKVNDHALELWASILRRVPGSRLVMLTPRGTARQRTTEKLQKWEISPDRVEFIDRQPREKYLEVYRRIDISLDTFPYNGHTTSLDSLWMGVPTVTLVGQTIVGRAGLSQLSNLGLPELVAHSKEEYARLAEALAANLPRLSQLRETLLGRMLKSPLGDSAGFARSIETCYRQAWRAWCAQ
jgi:protein O-GlcNAc transferase